jgi:SAM-dependent methyltransferase
LRECHAGHGSILLAWAWETPEAYEAQYADQDYHVGACLKLGIPAQPTRFAEHSLAGRCRIQWLERHHDFQTVLDVGASNGAFVHAALRYGSQPRQVYGLEPSRYMCDWVWGNLQLPLRHGGWRDVHGYWDLLTAHDVLEHLLEPQQFLSRMRHHARALHLELPLWEADRPADWKHIKPYEHPWLPSPAAVRQLANQAGWTLVAADEPVPGKQSLLFR